MRYTALMMCLASPLAAQETYDFKGVSNLEVRNGVRVEVRQGPEVTVTAEAISGDVANVEFRQFGEWLVVSRNQRWLIFPYGRQDDIVVTITLPTVNNFKARSEGVLVASGFDTSKFRGEALEGGTVILTDMTFDAVTLFATDGGLMTVDGTCADLRIEATQGATLNTADLVCGTAKATARSDGVLSAQATDMATVRERSGGEVTLTGGAEIVDEFPALPEG